MLTHCDTIWINSRTFVGYKLGRSLLIDDGALPWIVANANNEASPIRRHIELALCHLAQHGTEQLYFSHPMSFSVSHRVPGTKFCNGSIKEVWVEDS